MRNQSKTNKRKIRIRITYIALEILNWLKNRKNILWIFKFKMLNSLVEMTKYKSIYSNGLYSIKYPQNSLFEVTNIGFSDIFFPEDFPKLKNGIHQLTISYPGYINDEEKIKNWFEEIQNSETGAFNSIFAGSFSFKDTNVKSLNLLSTADIHLVYVHPSFIILSIVVQPSNIFKQKYNGIIRDTSHSQLEFLGFSWKSGITRYTEHSPKTVMETELDELFMSINRSIINLFGKFFKSGLSRFGALPSIEIIETDISLREIPKKDIYALKNRFPELLSIYNFLFSIGYPPNNIPIPIYSECDWWHIYELHRNQDYFARSKSYQMLISTSDYNKSESKAENTYLDSYFPSISGKLNRILCFLALENFYHNFEDLIIDIKSYLDPSFYRQKKGDIFQVKLKNSIERVIAINNLYYQQERVWTSVNEEILYNYFFKEIEDILGLYNNKSITLSEEFKYRITNKRNFCKEELSFIRTSYEEMLTYQSVDANYRLQKSTYLLSIAVFVFTIITVIPEKVRERIILFLMNIFS